MDYNVYFDESGTHAGSPALVLSAYVFQKNKANVFNREWAIALDSFGLEFAHMADCALGFGPYRGMSKPKRVQIQKALIKSIRKRTLFGLTLQINERQFDDIIDKSGPFKSAYALMLMTLVNQITRRLLQSDPAAKISFVFEDGHESQSEANFFMNGFKKANIDIGSSYKSHAFSSKKEDLALQAADMLAWHHHHAAVRKLKGHIEPRKDFVALMRPQDMFAEVEDKYLIGLRGLCLAYQGEHLSTLEEMTALDMAERNSRNPLMTVTASNR